MNILLENISKNKKYHFNIFLLILAALTYLMIYCYMPLDKINPGHDYLFHYRRMLSLMESIKENQSLIYIDNKALNGYGYATKWFYPDFILIPFAIIGNVVGIVGAYKSMYFTMTFLCGLFTYISINKIYKNTIMASFSGILFTFCIYRLQDLYERGALGESLSFTFVPIVIWGLYEIIKGNHKKWYIISFGFSLMIFTHMISTILMFVTILIILAIYHRDLLKEPKRIANLIIAGVVSIILSGYFLFPFVEQLASNTFYFQIVEGDGVESATPVSIAKIIYGMVSIGLPFIKSLTFMPQIGLLLTIGIILRFFIKNKVEKKRSIDFAVIIGLIYILAGLSTKIWGYYPLKTLDFIQFPWRLFEFSSFFFAIAGGYYLSVLLKNKESLIIGSLAVVSITTITIISLSYSYKSYNNYDNHTIPEATLSNQYLYLMGFEYIPHKLVDLVDVKAKGDKIDIKNSDTKITNFERSKNKIDFNIVLSKPDIAELPLIYYKGYYAKIDNKLIPVEESERGFVQVPIEKSGHIEVNFSGTPIQKYSIYITIISFFLLGIYIYVTNYKKKINA